MRRQDLNRKLERLHRDAERISANLVELELDPIRQLLEATNLEGHSAARRSSANAAFTELWRRHLLLEEVLRQADEIRGPSHADKLEALLEGPSIELAVSDVPIAQRDLLGSANADVRCSLDALLSDMSSSFDQVRSVIFEIDGAWTTLTPKLDDARRLLEEDCVLAAEAGEASRPDLASVRDTLETLSARTCADPLSVDAGDIDRLLGELRSMEHDLQSTIALKRGFESRIRDAHALLEQIQVSAHAGQDAFDQTQAKIAASQVPPPPELDNRLESELGDIIELGRRNAWPDARRALTDWSARADATIGDLRRTLAAIRAPIETRNRYRAMLDAYQVKAKRHGILEDRALAETAARAKEALYTAPTDLAASAELIRSYQQAVNAAGATAEVTP